MDFNYRNGDALAFANSSFTTIPESQLGMEDLLCAAPAKTIQLNDDWRKPWVSVPDSSTWTSSTP